MASRAYQESIVINASPEAVYSLVTDIGRTGEWSPICKSCWWHDGGSARVGAQFTGRNEFNGRTWDTVSTVIAAEPGKEFAWSVSEDFVRWGYRISARDGGSELTEFWEFRPAGLQRFHNKYGDESPVRIEARTEQARRGIPATLAAIKRIIENE